MGTQYSIESSSAERSLSKSKIITGIVIFMLGVIAGVVGLCIAIKVIFYIGLTVAAIAAVALVVGIIALKQRIDDD